MLRHKLFLEQDLTYDSEVIVLDHGEKTARLKNSDTDLSKTANYNIVKPYIINLLILSANPDVPISSRGFTLDIKLTALKTNERRLTRNRATCLDMFRMYTNT